MAYWVDDSFDSWPQVVRAGTAAVGLYLRCGPWISRQLTDGDVPAEVAAMYGTREWAQRLVDVGLWSINEQGYHDEFYLAMNNPTREVVLERRAAAARRQAEARARRNPAAYQRKPSRVTNARITDDSQVSSRVSPRSPALPSPSGGEGRSSRPVRAVPGRAGQCPIHVGQPADHCGPCASERKAARDDYPVTQDRSA